MESNRNRQAIHASSETVLDIKHVSVDYETDNDTVHAVNDVSFTLRRGQILGLAGESGSGKSTLAYAIARLLRPPALIINGSIIYYPHAHHAQREAGKQRKQRNEKFTEPVDILRLSEKQLNKLRWDELSMVFQSAMNALNPVLTIGEQIIDVLDTHRPEMGADRRKQRALELLQVVGIAPDRMRSYPHELSGGMRQRAIIAIALALNPDIIILDEPTTALDVVIQREILLEIVRLRENFGFAVIFITHDLSLLLELADEVAIMYAGRIIETATQDEMYRRPRHPYSYGLLNSFPSLTGPRRKMYGIPGSPPDLRNIPTGCAFHPRCPMTFEVCPKELPQLLPIRNRTPDTVTNSSRAVACHLYDSRYRMSEPEQSEITSAYNARAEKREGIIS